MDCASRTVARTDACAEFMAIAEKTASTGDGRRRDGNPTLAELAFTLIVERESLRAVILAVSEQPKTNNANGTRWKTIAGASRLCEMRTAWRIS